MRLRRGSKVEGRIEIGNVDHVTGLEIAVCALVDLDLMTDHGLCVNFVLYQRADLDWQVHSALEGQPVDELPANFLEGQLADGLPSFFLDR